MLRNHQRHCRSFRRVPRPLLLLRSQRERRVSSAEQVLLAVYASEAVGQRAQGQGEATAAERGGEFGRVRAYAFLHLLRGFERGKADHRELLPRHRLAEEDGGSFGEHDGRSEVVCFAEINTMDVQQHEDRVLWVLVVVRFRPRPPLPLLF